MKKYKFKLEALLKLRQAIEMKAKIELGKVNREIQSRKNLIEQCTHEIKIAYEAQEESAKMGATAKELSFYPYYVDQKRNHIKQSQKEIEDLQVVFNEKRRNVEEKRGDLKLIENMKEKDKDNFIKKLKKKMHEDLEDDYIITRSTRREL